MSRLWVWKPSLQTEHGAPPTSLTGQVDLVSPPLTTNLLWVGLSIMWLCPSLWIGGEEWAVWWTALQPTSSERQGQHPFPSFPLVGSMGGHKGLLAPQRVSAFYFWWVVFFQGPCQKHGIHTFSWSPCFFYWACPKLQFPWKLWNCNFGRSLAMIDLFLFRNYAEMYINYTHQ